jgi:hypothetical protein
MRSSNLTARGLDMFNVSVCAPMMRALPGQHLAGREAALDLRLGASYRRDRRWRVPHERRNGRSGAATPRSLRYALFNGSPRVGVRMRASTSRYGVIVTIDTRLPREHDAA